MNKEQRKIIDDVMNMVSDAKSSVEGVRDQEQEAYDAMSEKVQEGEKGEKAQAVLEALEEAINDLDTAIGNLDTAKE